ncbi:MAG: hypothetical protein LIV22_05775, partial [Olegusella sp.]|nr:hypothetical protein [Olegusella sp.]
RVFHSTYVALDVDDVIEHITIIAFSHTCPSCWHPSRMPIVARPSVDDMAGTASHVKRRDLEKRGPP